ncbi:MAG: NADP oxidoreductase [Dehalococcoidia bacterium]|nr:MAG: NADP oxidoreductase [Dehalococcoidia bacterium]
MPEKKVVLRNCRVIDPRQIDSYLARDGFQALKKARDEMTPEQVIAEVKASGLRGRGGAGFPCGLKWELARKSQEAEKYIIANADEGEMGTFKDRYILENDPFSLIEALAIAGYAVGAEKGYIYLRAEYHNLLDLLTNAIKQAKQKGRLDFDIELREGAGAYVCGEETALMDSIEGKRGEIRYRPPYPPTKGLWQRPTVINNVETLMNIPPIILNGAGWFSKMGTAESKGTKVFSVSGDVNKPGVYELVMGSSLRELVAALAQAERVRMVQVGGAGGRILPYAMIDTSLAYESVLGAGAVIVLDESRDAIDVVYKSLEFMAEESCGKCAPCREGTEVMMEIIGRFWRGEGEARDLKILPELAEVMRLASLCGLGQTTPTPVIDSLQYFSGDYQNKIGAKGGARV